MGIDCILRFEFKLNNKDYYGVLFFKLKNLHFKQISRIILELSLTNIGFSCE